MTTYIPNWSLEPFSWNYDLASHTTDAVCINFTHVWRSLQYMYNRIRTTYFYFARQFFAGNLLRENRRRNIYAFCSHFLLDYRCQLPPHFHDMLSLVRKFQFHFYLFNSAKFHKFWGELFCFLFSIADVPLWLSVVVVVHVIIFVGNFFVAICYFNEMISI